MSNISLSSEFALPAVNEFIPSDLSVHRTQVLEKKNKPDLIRDTPIMRIWYKKDDTFWVPKTNVWIYFKNPLCYATPRNCVILEQVHLYEIITMLTFHVDYIYIY